MDGDLHPERLRGAALLDVIFATVVMATLAISILTLLSNGSREELARDYARQFHMATEDDCPRAFGKSFWFACASEVRQFHPPAGMTSSSHSQVGGSAGPLASGSQRSR